LEVVITLARTIECSDHRLADFEWGGVKSSYAKGVVAAASELERMDANFIAPLFGQPHGEPALIARIVHFDENLFVLGVGIRQFQDRVELSTRDVRNDRFA